MHSHRGAMNLPMNGDVSPIVLSMISRGQGNWLISQYSRMAIGISLTTHKMLLTCITDNISHRVEQTTSLRFESRVLKHKFLNHWFEILSYKSPIFENTKYLDIMQFWKLKQFYELISPSLENTKAFKRGLTELTVIWWMSN